MRRIVIAIIVLVVSILFFFNHFSYEKVSGVDVADYYRHNSYDYTKSENAVTAIYLNYRYYDTIFESLMLLVCISALIHMSVHEGKDGEED